MLIPPRELHRDNSGVVMITVLVLVLIMTVVAIGILGINISQVSTSQSVVDSIKAEQLAIGAFYQYHQQQIEAGDGSGGGGGSSSQETLDGKTFQIGIDNLGSGGPNNTDQIEVTVNFI